MSSLPWVRFFPSDWLAGSRGMSAAETGVYISLIAMMYERGEPLAEDHGRLARLCGASNSQFRKALESLVAEGKILRLEAGLWNGRVQKEQVYRSEKSEVGKQAAEKRWQKDKQNQSPSGANAMRSQCQGNANQKPEPDIEADASIKKRADALFAEEFAQSFWPLYPNKIGKPAALVSFTRARKTASLEEIMVGLQRYIDDKPPDRAWLNPTTFLNQQRWADQPATVTPKPLGGSNGYRTRDDDLKAAFQDIRASRGVREPAVPSEQDRTWDGDKLASREITYERGTGGGDGGNQWRPAVVAGRGHR